MVGLFVVALTAGSPHALAMQDRDPPRHKDSRRSKGARRCSANALCFARVPYSINYLSSLPFLLSFALQPQKRKEEVGDKNARVQCQQRKPQQYALFPASRANDENKTDSPAPPHRPDQRMTLIMANHSKVIGAFPRYFSASFRCLAGGVRR